MGHALIFLKNSRSVVKKSEFHDPVPDRTTLMMKLRRERWGKNGVFDDLMREVVGQCVEAGLVAGKPTVQNIKRLARFLSHRQAGPVSFWSAGLFHLTFSVCS